MSGMYFRKRLMNISLTKFCEKFKHDINERIDREGYKNETITRAKLSDFVCKLKEFLNMCLKAFI